MFKKSMIYGLIARYMLGWLIDDKSKEYAKERSL